MLADRISMPAPDHFVVGSSTCQASRTKPASVWQRARIRSASWATRTRSASCSRLAFSALIRGIFVAGSGKRTEHAFETCEVITAQLREVHCLDRPTVRTAVLHGSQLGMDIGAAAFAMSSRRWSLAFGLRMIFSM
jgi:hypothetical protein